MSVEKHLSPKIVVFKDFSCLRAQRPFSKIEKVHPGVVVLHVMEGFLFTPPKRVTSHTWGTLPPCIQALRSNDATATRASLKNEFAFLSF